MYKLGINLDEISNNIDVALKTMREEGVKYAELRTLNKKNFVFWNDGEINTFKEKMNKSGIKLVAAATPLFKWYENTDDPEIPHDSFGFNPRLSNFEKKKIIQRTIVIAKGLGIPRLRIFSGLGNVENAGNKFAQNDLLNYALDLADVSDIDLYLENEPVCNVHSKREIMGLLKSNEHKRLKLWLDIANLVELGEDVDLDFIKQVAPRLGYIHVKDFITKSNQKVYVPAGDGDIDYVEIMKRINTAIEEDIVVTVETHAQKNKIKMSVASMRGTMKILKEAGVNYE